jgi:hypothetical protein
MPSGLDVMAALGNQEAVALLAPELERFQYAANLLAARTLIERAPKEIWNSSAYNVWLSALTKLDDLPAEGFVPEIMLGRAWQRKQLQTQLASWAELRHDTILYAKQSFTVELICEYPTGYVEPYPAFFARVAVLAEQGKRWLAGEQLMPRHMAAFLDNFAQTVRRLERLAAKELAAQPFDDDERQFVKDTVSLKWRKGGCAGPVSTYSGWYPQLIYGGNPEDWQPTVADVHTSNTGEALEVGVGDTNLLVAAIDNAGDRAAYVGPVYSYYEFPSPSRLTDEEWQATIKAGKTPPRPVWVESFQPLRP